jgi:hypothetical protein
VATLHDPHLWVHDKSTGEMLAQISLPANATGSPVTYMAGGKQFIVFPVGGGPLEEELSRLGFDVLFGCPRPIRGIIGVAYSDGTGRRSEGRGQ